MISTKGIKYVKLTEYRMRTETNWTMLYKAMYLKTPNDVTKAARPSLITVGTHSILGVREVKGEATDASASDSEMPACAVLRAPQSLAPSPHIPTMYLKQKIIMLQKSHCFRKE